MSSVHVTAILFTLFLHVILGIAFFGWGNLILFSAGLLDREGKSAPVTSPIWLGWAGTLFLLQLMHFVLPLIYYSVIPLVVCGILLSSILLYRERHHWRATLSTLPVVKALIVICMMFVVFFWVGSRSMLSPENCDSGLYHFSSIRWINSFPIVPGLGNLHGRLAFNQSFFSYVAALNLHPFWGHGRSIANSFLLLLTILTLVEASLTVIRRRVPASEMPPMEWAPGGFCLPIVVYWALSSNDLASPSPDLTSGLLQVVIFVIFGQAVVDYARDRTVSHHDSLVLFILAATAVTVKLSNTAFGGVVMALVLIGSLQTSRKRVRDSARLLLPAVLIVLVLCARGVVLSGAPLYPSTLGYVYTEWSVPLDKVIEEANWVYSWARQPNLHWGDVLDNWDWLGPWFQKLLRNLTVVVYPVGAFFALTIIHLTAAVIWKAGSRKLLFIHWLVLLPLLSGLVFWFSTAPDPRFAHALFLLLPVSASLLLAGHVQKRVNGAAFAVVIIALFLAANFNLLYWVYKNTNTIRQISLDGWHDVRQDPLNEKVTDSGLHVWIPVTGECWDAPLPCTPYLEKKLRLREAHDLSAGFAVALDRTN